jgi:hypothetical protein
VLKIIKANLGDILIGLLLLAMAIFLVWFFVREAVVDDPTHPNYSPAEVSLQLATH